MLPKALITIEGAPDKDGNLLIDATVALVADSQWCTTYGLGIKLELRISPGPSGVRSPTGSLINPRVAYHDRAEDPPGGGFFYHPATTSKCCGATDDEINTILVSLGFLRLP